MKLTGFRICIRKEHVFQMIDMKKESNIFQEVSEEYDNLLSEVFKRITPVALYEFGQIQKSDALREAHVNHEVLYSVLSLGKAISEWSAALFKQGNYLAGMLVNAMADDYLFQMDSLLQETVISICKKENYGVAARLEAPQDISIQVHRTAWEVTKAYQEIGLLITGGFMFDPVKTLCQVYLLEEGADIFYVEHDCSHCGNINCRTRNLDRKGRERCKNEVRSS